LEKVQRGLEDLFYGLHLRNLVFGEGGSNIKQLELSVIQFGCGFVLIGRLVAPSLSSLKIGFRGSPNHYQTLEIISHQMFEDQIASTAEF
jgi:hypothetical protein